MTSRYRGEDAVPLFTWRDGNCAHHQTISCQPDVHSAAGPPPFSRFWIKRIAASGSHSPPPHLSVGLGLGPVFVRGPPASGRGIPEYLACPWHDCTLHTPESD